MIGALCAGFLMAFFFVALLEVHTSMRRIVSDRWDLCTMGALLTGKVREKGHCESGVEGSWY